MTIQKRYWKLDQYAPTSWVLTLSNPPDNRLPPDVIVDLMKRLDEIEAAWRSAWDKAPDDKKPGGSVVFASDSKKFWSNGLDPTKLTSPAFMQRELPSGNTPAAVGLETLADSQTSCTPSSRAL